MKSKIFKPALFAFLFVIGHACSYQDSAYDGNSDTGTGGSMARFTIAGDRLFTVDNESLNVFDISSVEDPVFMEKTHIGFGVETIFPLGDLLFLGTNSGMYIYETNQAGIPGQVSFYEHVIACDPVVSDGNFAYVTLSSVRQDCWRSVDELQIINLQDIRNPQLVARYPMNNPRGLAIRNDSLWVCDNGLKILDVSDKLKMEQLHHFDGFPAYDLILDGDRAIVVGESGFVQYRLENDTIKKLSEIKVEL